MPTKWIAWQQVASLIQADDGVRLLLSVEQLVDVAVSMQIRLPISSNT